MRRRLVIVPALLLVVAAGCGGDDDAATATVTEPSAVPSTTVPSSAVPSTTVPPTTAPAATAGPTTAPAPSTTAPPPTTAAGEPWSPVAPGEYSVGVATITVDDPAGVRPLTVDVWFPLDAGVDVGSLALEQYTLLPGVYYESPFAYAATPDLAAAGPFPLVVYSHGSSGLRYIHSAYTEALASHGYVVAAPDHTGNTAVDLIAGADVDIDQLAYQRPLDVERVIDAMVDPAHPTAGPYAAHVDAERIAVTGHSFGGFTSIAVATGFSNDVGEVAPDARIDAIVPIAPAVSNRFFTEDEFAGLGIPMMVVVGTDDTTTPVDPNVTMLWDGTTNSPAYRVELVHAEHQTFTDVCAYQEALPTLTAVPQVVVDTIDDFAVQGCSEGDMDDARANELLTTYVIEFLDEVFNGGPAITSTPPDDVLFQSR